MYCAAQDTLIGMCSLLHLECRSISNFNLNLIGFVSTWQKRPRELDHRLRFQKKRKDHANALDPTYFALDPTYFFRPYILCICTRQHTSTSTQDTYFSASLFNKKDLFSPNEAYLRGALCTKEPYLVRRFCKAPHTHTSCACVHICTRVCCK